MHSSPPFPHVQNAQDQTGDSPEEITERNFRHEFILVLFFAIIAAIGLIELMNSLHK